MNSELASRYPFRAASRNARTKGLKAPKTPSTGSYRSPGMRRVRFSERIMAVPEPSSSTLQWAHPDAQKMIVKMSSQTKDTSSRKDDSQSAQERDQEEVQIGSKMIHYNATPSGTRNDSGRAHLLSVSIQGSSTIGHLPRTRNILRQPCKRQSYGMKTENKDRGPSTVAMLVQDQSRHERFAHEEDVSYVSETFGGVYTADIYDASNPLTSSGALIASSEQSRSQGSQSAGSVTRRFGSVVPDPEDPEWKIWENFVKKVKRSRYSSQDCAI